MIAAAAAGVVAGVVAGSFLDFEGTADQADRASREHYQIVAGLAFSTDADVVASF